MVLGPLTRPAADLSPLRRARFWSLVLLALSACEPPAVRTGPLCSSAQSLEFLQGTRVGSRVESTVTLRNSLSVPAEFVVTAPPAPFSVEQTGTLRLAPGES